jgi:hypothetical protein
MKVPVPMTPDLITPADLQAVLAELQALEPVFHAAHADATPAQFERLVAPQFWEVGASGNRYSRAFALQVLTQREAPPEAHAWQTADWHLAPAGADHYLLTYTLMQPGRITRRLSVWHRTVDGWQVVYHQGTVVQEPPLAFLHVARHSPQGS